LAGACLFATHRQATLHDVNKGYHSNQRCAQFFQEIEQEVP
jgi:hypothetical protein